MANKLEKKFFDTFDIKPKTIIEPRYSLNTEYYENKVETYPQITDHIYLMLLAILTCVSNIEFPFVDIQKLKEDILKGVIKHQYEFDKHQVRTLFEEVER